MVYFVIKDCITSDDKTSEKVKCMAYKNLGIYDCVVRWDVDKESILQILLVITFKDWLL